MHPDERPKWHIHKINDDGSIGTYVADEAVGLNAEEALTNAANSVHAGLYDCDQLYLVSRNTDSRGLNVYGAKILRLTVPPRPRRVAEAVTF